MKIVAFFKNECNPFLDDIIDLMNYLNNSPFIDDVFFDLDLSKLESIIFDKNALNRRLPY